MSNLEALFRAHAAGFARRQLANRKALGPGAGPQPRNLADIQAELRAIEAQHDALFEYTDDYGVWHKGHEEQARMRALRVAIERGQQ